jgi:hypothetical protein
VDNLASGKQQDIQSQIKDAYLQKLNLVRQTAYQPSMKEILKEALLDGLIPWRATIRAISNGETPAHIAQKAAIDTLQFLPTLFVGAGAGLHAGETMTKVMLSEFAALSEKGIVDVLKRSSARIARHHATELLGSAAEVAKTAVQDTFWLPLGMWHTLRAGETLIAGKISHTPLAQKLSAAAAATEHTAIAQTWRLSDSATTSAEKSYVKATDPAGDSQLLQRMGPNQFATLNPQNLVPQRPLFVSTPQGELTTTFLPVLQNCRLTEDKDALILKQIATQQENKSHLFQVGFRFYAQLETTEKNYVYVEVRPYRTSRGATDWRLYDPKISHPGLLPSIVWNEIAGKWQPLERLRLRGGGNTLKKQAIETRSHGNDADFSDMKKVNIDGETYFVANEADADDGTHYRLYVPDPSNPLTLVCSRIAKFDHTEGWKTIEVGSNGLGNSRNIKIPHPANNAGSDISAYEIPTDMKKYILDADSRTLSGLYMNTNAEPEEEIAISLWRQKREQLFQDAKNFFKDNHPLPSRPLIPVLKQNAKSNEIIEEIYKRANGMIIGESHNSIASKKFLIDNMENYQKNGVETLYMEHLQSDIHQADLDKYYQSGEMPNNLKTFLETQDRQHHTDRKKRYTFIEIVKAAYKNKIRIVAIDCSESYIIRELQDTHSKGTNNIRIKIFNYYSTKTINHDQAKKSSKWVALVGNTHTNTYNGIPGVAELNAAIGVQICDVEGPPMKVLVDPEVNIHYDPYFHPHSLDTHANEVTIVKPDLKIEMSTRLSASNRHRSLRNYDFSSISEDMKKIHKKAFFIYKNPTSDEYELLYKLSADEPVKKLVIKKTSVKNQIYIEDCPDIEAINNKKFKNISTLVDVLQRNGITWAEK